MSVIRERNWIFEHTHLKRSRLELGIKQRDGFSNYPPPLSLLSSSTYLNNIPEETPPPPPPPPPLTASSPDTKISPAVLFIIVILAFVFFISGLLHLLVRFLTKHPFSSSNSDSNGYPEISASDALQRQLQQLFNLHDSGLDQAFIDTLPVFLYEEIVGPKEPFDCAVCLSEFSEKDKLRLLPMCSHAFHINCIDTWLLSNSTCPLCRGTLFTPGFSMENPIFEFDDTIEEYGRSAIRENGFSSSQKAIEIEENAVGKGVLPVRLGKFRKLNDVSEEASEGETSNSNLDARRCYSMGSYQYVVGGDNLRVSLCPRQTRHDVKLVRDIESNGNSCSAGDPERKKIMSKGDSYSISKIWLWPKNGNFSSSADALVDIPPPGTELHCMEETENG
ncbi:hypothetical protein Nepgr_001180 [Nepenthes gracilis]|uniref:RING-type E3 ubiquitin transferase n=1 Tax=Nepenthes gracilis TaxID=150966 RepID=A0AAD3P4D8_NEPGR|nr:hypothetical protein Nepgr_001180 [Nepenthes gracilis]